MKNGHGKLENILFTGDQYTWLGYVEIHPNIVTYRRKLGLKCSLLLANDAVVDLTDLIMRFHLQSWLHTYTLLIPDIAHDRTCSMYQMRVVTYIRHAGVFRSKFGCRPPA